MLSVLEMTRHVCLIPGRFEPTLNHLNFDSHEGPLFFLNGKNMRKGKMKRKIILITLIASALCVKSPAFARPLLSV